MNAWSLRFLMEGLFSNKVYYKTPEGTAVKALDYKGPGWAVTKGALLGATVVPVLNTMGLAGPIIGGAVNYGTMRHHRAKLEKLVKSGAKEISKRQYKLLPKGKVSLKEKSS